MALNATVCDIAADSYVTLDEANAYFEGHYNAAKTASWALLSDVQKERVLKQAVTMLETIKFFTADGWWEVAFEVYPSGQVYKATADQSLSFPRNLDIVDNEYVIPQAVKDAQCEQAIFLLSVDESAVLAQLQGIRSESLGAGPARLSTTYSGNGVLIAPLAWEFIKQFVQRSTQLRRA